jgi:NADPH-dependent 2,4-dienoyl-CoA reductase/sulfur reductase-like enzyme
VVVHTNTPVDQLRSDGSRVTGVDPAGGDDPIEAGLVILGIGIRPNADLAADAGIELGDSGAIATDDYGCTNAPNVYAAGDCAEARHTVTGDSAWVPLGLTANRAGRAIGATVAGSPTTVGSIAGTAVVKAFDLGAGRTGLLDGEQAREEGFDPVRETITAGSRSGYYPGASETTVTMVADKESHRVLGASTVGEDHAAKRIDTVATALEANLTVEECERLDLGYAPPFSPVWDPILVASKVLAGSLSDD